MPRAHAAPWHRPGWPARGLAWVMVPLLAMVPVLAIQDGRRGGQGGPRDAISGARIRAEGSPADGSGLRPAGTTGLAAPAAGTGGSPTADDRRPPAGPEEKSAGPPAAAEPPQEPGSRKGWKPNIIVILIDTLRADALPAYASDASHAAEAPYLSGLAEAGIVFERVWSTASYTAPATASLFTSLEPEDHGVVVGHLATRKVQKQLDPSITLNRIPEAALTMGEVMKSAGYRTFGLSDNYNASTEMGFGQGFDRFQSNPRWYWGAEEMVRRLVDWRREITSGGPYFLYIHFIDPHIPYHKRPRWYRGVTTAVSENGEPLSREELQSRKAWANYLSEVGYLDDQMRTLHRLFRWDRNTIILVTSDHGEEFGEHGGRSHGKTLYEEVLRIPLFIRDATGRFGTGRVAQAVSILDILPTLAEMVGGPVDGRMQGRSLLPLMEAVTAGSEPDGWPGRRALFGHVERHVFHDPGGEDAGGEKKHEWHVIDSAVRGRWKLIRDSRGKSELFDLEADPRESSSRLGEDPRVDAEMEALLRAFLRRERIFPPERFEKTLSPEELERLKSLGYVE